MVGQQDWYLHEYVTPPPVLGVQPVDGYTPTYFCIASGTMTLSVSARWGGNIQAGDFLVAWLDIPRTANYNAGVYHDFSAVSERLFNYEWHQIVDGNDVRPPFNVIYGGFLANSNDKFKVTRRGTFKGMCARYTVVRGMSKRVGINLVRFPGARYSGGRDEPEDISATVSRYDATGGRAHMSYPPYGIGRKGIIFTDLDFNAGGTSVFTTGGIVASGDSLTLSRHVLYGPAPVYIEGRAWEPAGASGGLFGSKEVRVIDEYTTTWFAELTGAKPPTSASHGMRDWQKISVLASTSWRAVVQWEHPQVYGGGTNTLGNTPGYKIPFVPTVSRTHVAMISMWFNSSDANSFSVIVEDPLGNENGLVMDMGPTSLQASIAAKWGGGFHRYIKFCVSNDGSPSMWNGLVGGTFVPSLTGTHYLSTYVHKDLTLKFVKHSLSTMSGYSGPQFGWVNEKDKSMLWYHDPAIDGELWGPVRLIHGRDADGATWEGRAWSRCYAGVWASATAPAMIMLDNGHPNWFWHQQDGTVARRSANGGLLDIGDYAMSNRSIHPKIYINETDDPTSWTFGHYYFEMNCIQASATSQFRLGFCVPSGLADGEIVVNPSIASYGTANGVAPFTGCESVSGSFPNMAAGGAHLGIELEYATASCLWRMYRNGSHAWTGRWSASNQYAFSDWAVNFFVQYDSPTRGNLFSLNFTGPFTYTKPTGARALDFIYDAS